MDVTISNMVVANIIHHGSYASCPGLHAHVAGFYTASMQVKGVHARRRIVGALNSVDIPVREEAFSKNALFQEFLSEAGCQMICHGSA